MRLVLLGAVIERIRCEPVNLRHVRVRRVGHGIEGRDHRPGLGTHVQILFGVDWDPVSGAVARAIELVIEFDGVASKLDDECSDSCEVSAFVDLSSAVDAV